MDDIVRDKLFKKLAIGTVQFGLDYGISNSDGKTSVVEGAKIIAYAGSLGIPKIDTAVGYGNSESVLGKMNLTNHEVISKFPKVNESGELRLHMAQSLSRLNLKKLYGYLAHSGQTLINSPTAIRELLELKAEGLTGKVGVSLYYPSELENLLDIGFIPDIVQIPYSIFDRRFECKFELLKSLNVEIHTRSTFLQGLFFLDPNIISSFFDEVKPSIHLLRKRYPHNKDLSAALLKFALNNPYLDTVVIGVNDVLQLNEISEGLMGETRLIENDFTVHNENILLPFKWKK